MSTRLTVGYGSPYVTDRIDVARRSGRRCHVMCSSFFQGNRYLLSASGGSGARADVQTGTVTELYAGVGSVCRLAGRSGLCATSWRWKGIDSSARDLEANAADVRSGGPRGALAG